MSLIIYNEILTCEEEQQARGFIQNVFQELPSVSLLSIDSGHIFTYKAVYNDTLVGVFQVSCVCDEAEIIVLAVDSDYRRQGIAKNFLMNFLNKCSNIKDIFLEVSCENVAAYLFYQSVGFHKVGERKRYYQNPISKKMEDALIMKLHLENYERRI